MKYIKYTVLFFLLLPLAVNANKYSLRGKNTKAEVIAMGLEVRNASQDRGVNQINAKANVLTYEIKTGNFKPCQLQKVEIIFFMPPKGVLFSGSLESVNGVSKIKIRRGEEDGFLITLNCVGQKNYSFPLVD